MLDINQQSIEENSFSKNQDIHLSGLLAEAEDQMAKSIDYIKFAAEETKTIRFDANKTKNHQTVNYGTVSVRNRWKFYGYEITASNDIRERKIQEWTTGPETAIKVLKQFVDGVYTQEITRHGNDISTTYEIKGVQ